MRLFGYEHTDPLPENIVPSALADITLVASAAELRAMAQFLADCADEMDRMGSKFDHVHLGDRIKAFRTSPHFVVARCNS